MVAAPSGRKGAEGDPTHIPEFGIRKVRSNGIAQGNITKLPCGKGGILGGGVPLRLVGALGTGKLPDPMEGLVGWIRIYLKNRKIIKEIAQILN